MITALSYLETLKNLQNKREAENFPFVLRDIMTEQMYYFDYQFRKL